MLQFTILKIDKMKRNDYNKIWIMNFEEVYGRQSSDRMFRDFCRHYFCTDSGDVYITSVGIPEDFIGYVNSVKGTPGDCKNIIRLDNLAKPYSICDSVPENPSAVQSFEEMISRQKYQLKPFYENRKVNQLSAFLGVPLGGTEKSLVESGLVEKFNDRLFFKDISVKLNIDTAPGYAVRGKTQIIQAINKICRKSSDRVFIKKTRLNGKNSNLKGEKRNLSDKLDGWLMNYEHDAVVEQYLDLADVCGSLVHIDNSGYDFIGINSQIMEDCVWQGCSIPCHCYGFSDEIRDKSLKYAEKFYRLGGRGSLNIDWGIAREGHGRLKLYALEINFRYNGFDYALDLLRICFGRHPGNSYAVFYNSFPISDGIKRFSSLIKMTRNITEDGETIMTATGKSRGAVFASCPAGNKVSLLIAGDSSSYIERVREKLYQALNSQAMGQFSG